MRIALVSDCYPPRLGGIEAQVHDLAGRLVGAGHEVEVVTATPDGGGARTVVEGGVVVHRVTLPLPGGLPVNPAARRVVRPLLREGRFDVVHAHMGVISPVATDVAFLAQELELPLVLTWHCLHGPWAPALQAAGHARRWAERGALLTAVSTAAALDLARVTGPGVPIEVLPNGIDGGWWRVGAPGPTARREGPLRVSLAMRLAARKRPHAAVRIIAAADRGTRAGLPGACGAPAGVRATVAGAGTGRALLAAHTARTDTPVALAGRLDRPGLRALFHRSDVHLVTARAEAFGIAALEARSSGLPVLALRRTGVADLVRDGVDGLLVDDDAGLVEALVAVARDDGLRVRLTEGALARPAPHDWSVVLSDHERTYARVAHPGSSPPSGGGRMTP